MYTHGEQYLHNQTNLFAQDFYAASKGFFKKLGYTSSRTLSRENLAKKNISDYFSTETMLNEELALKSEWKQFYFLFQLTADEIQQVSRENFSSNGSENYQSYYFFALELAGDKFTYSKTQIENIGKAINRFFVIPSIILIMPRFISQKVWYTRKRVTTI